MGNIDINKFKNACVEFSEASRHKVLVFSANKDNRVWSTSFCTGDETYEQDFLNMKPDELILRFLVAPATALCSVV